MNQNNQSTTMTMKHTYDIIITAGRLVRVSKAAVDRNIRGRVVQVTGLRPATPWDRSRVVVRLVDSDGALGDEYLVTPSILVAL